MGPTNQTSRCGISKGIPSLDSPALQASLQGVCTYVLSPLPGRCPARPGTAPEYQLQALCFVHRRAQLSEWEGLLGPAGRFGGQHAEERLRCWPHALSKVLFH